MEQWNTEMMMETKMTKYNRTKMKTKIQIKAHKKMMN